MVWPSNGVGILWYALAPVLLLLFLAAVAGAIALIVRWVQRRRRR